MKTFGKVIKYTALSISFFIFAYFMFRLCSSGAPKAVTGIVWSPDAREAYLASPETFEALEQPQQIIITNDGRFWIQNVIYIPAAKQLQLTIKYNDSTVKYLKEALGTEDIAEGPFVYTLLDDAGNRYESHTEEAVRKLNYNYRLLAFDNIDLTDIRSMYVDIYYAGAVNYEEAPYSTLMTWNASLPTEKRDIPKELPDDLK